MKSKGLVLCTVLAASQALSGCGGKGDLSGVFQSERGPVVLKDKDGRALALENGDALALRFSKKSRSFFIEKKAKTEGAKGDRREFKVTGGFPKGDLKNFELAGSAFGDPGLGLRGETSVAALGSSVSNENQGCSYSCG
jgi:hypothetical protein